MSGEASEIDVIQSIYNGTTDSELSSLSHVDAPSEGVYMVCGVLIAMILVALIIVLLAVTISKLRKREENLHTTNSPQAVTTTATANHNNNNNNNNNNNIQPTEVVTTTTVTTTAVAVTTSDNLPPPFLWQYHNGSTNTTVASSQYTLYNTDEDTLVHNLPCEEPRECKGFRKNLSGKWRRLVKKKQQQEVYTIPAELRDQLKQIYVY